MGKARKLGNNGMAYKATIFKVMIASPGDVEEERNVIREAIHEWNSIHSTARKIALLPVGWDTDSTPEMGDRPQAIINYQLPKDCDLLVAVFWTRIGTATTKAVSGTVEEIEEHIKDGKPAMIYFSNAPVEPDSIDPTQYAALKEFKRLCKEKGLIESYQSKVDFRSKFSRQLAAKINQDKFFGIENGEDVFAGVNFNPPGSLVSSLSEKAKNLLREASQDQSGVVLLVDTDAGKNLQTNGKSFIETGKPRSRAEWEAVIEELERFNPSLLTLDYSSENITRLKVTKREYEVAELI
jgi:hypothetical protein